MLHLGAARKAEQGGAAGLGKSELGLDGQRSRVEMEHAGIDGWYVRGGKQPVEADGDRLCHDAAAPERAAQPIADDGATGAALKTDLADHARVRRVDPEIGFLERDSGQAGALPGPYTAPVRGKGHARPIAGPSASLAGTHTGLVLAAL